MHKIPYFSEIISHRQQEERERQAQLRGAPTMDPDIAATKIQKVINCTVEIIIIVLLYLYQA